MNFRDLVLKNRTCRRFHEATTITESVLRELVDLGRLSASGGNLQPLKYLLSWDAVHNAKIFPCLAWAAYLEGWSGPAEGERPSAYIVILLDKEVANSSGQDAGIAAQNILLGATERGLAGCMVGSVRRESLRAALAIPDRYDIVLVLALGKPKETIVLEAAENGRIKYWRDDRSVHHVPKRPLKEIVLDL